ncbi:MAG: bifunctional rhamnulose-1-phosphate aldolase/short-chain dehydrogenase [Chloroflexi bacterium]|nr:bifunctional rhamnulose-1-phosphate aldolase/short-chain dehydrogenase [Chloroflexota bacterium]
MKSLWSEEEASNLSPLDQLVYQSRLIGADPSLVLWGGGNTSLKLVETDFRGRECRVMRVKGSGTDMKAIQRQGFPGVLLEDVLPLFDREDMSDEDMVEYLNHCLVEPNAPRPSIETLLHAFLPQASVVHSHADAILSITNTERPKAHLFEAFGDLVTVVPYRRPGFLLSKEVALAAQENANSQGVVLLNHGLVTWGETPQAAYESHIELVMRAEELLRGKAQGRRVFTALSKHLLETADRRKMAVAIAPAIRGLVSQRQRAVLRFEDGPDVLEFATSTKALELTTVGAATPDHLLNTKQTPLLVDVKDPPDLDALRERLRQGVGEYARSYERWYFQHTDGEHPMLDPYPRVILIPGIGMWTTGRDGRAARIAADIYRHTIDIVRGAQALGRYTSLSPEEAYRAEYWPLELYKQTLAPPERELAGRVALVTGAASGIGRAIARRFAREGAHVVITDVDIEVARALAQDMKAAYGEDRVACCKLDVTSEEDVQAAFETSRLAFGGLDILVSNAGIALTSPLDSLGLAEWNRSLAVNATGHFLAAREAVRLMKEQGLGGSLVFIATKNVPAPGQDFGAYSAAKAAEAQLARVLAIENGPFGIRSNMVNPDAIFQDTKLWSPRIRAERAQAHGIPVEDVEEFYRQRSLLKTAVTVEDVAEAALFLAGDRSLKTTGTMLPVDGGVREAFPR